jgi:hypothetical protein
MIGSFAERYLPLLTTWWLTPLHEHICLAPALKYIQVLFFLRPIILSACCPTLLEKINIDIGRDLEECSKSELDSVD